MAGQAPIMSMGKVEKSSDSVMSAFDLFGTPHTHTSVVRGDWVEVPPVRDNTDDVVEFDLPGTDDLYTDLYNTYLYVKLKVTLADGANLGAANDCTVLPGDNFFHSLFNAVTIKINGQDVEYEPNYGYRAFLESVLNFGSEAKKTHLVASSGWSQDGVLMKDYDGGNANDINLRKRILSESRTLDYFGKLRLSLFSQERYLFPGVSCSIQLRRSSPKFCLMAEGADPAGGAKITFLKTDLFVRKIHPNPALNKAQIDVHHSMKKELVMPISRIKTHLFHIPIGVRQHRINLEHNGQRPVSLLVGLVDHTAQNGTYEKNPFSFKHFNCNGVEVSINGLPIHRKLEPDYAAGNYSRSYMSLFTGRGRSGGKDTENCMTYTQYGNGGAIYMFDNSGDLCEGGLHLIGNASITINLTFSAPTTANLTAVIYQEKDDVIYISPEQQVRSITGIL